MKVQLLYLDAHDDQVSVRDKMGWIKTPRLLVVWPRRGRVLTSRLDLTLIQRQAARRGAKLGLVTFDPDVRDHAQELGIPVFDSVDSTPEAIWQAAAADAHRFEAARPHRERLEDAPPRRPAGRRPASRWAIVGRWTAFAVGVAAVATLITALGPSATLVVSPKTTVLRTQFQVQLDPEADTLTEDNRMPAERRSLEVSGELRLPASGKILVPASAAEGSVVFTNLGQDSITLPSGTGVRAGSPGRPRFETEVPVTLEAGAGSQSAVAVRAAQAGSQGNVPAGAIGSIDGPLGLQVSVTNPDPTHGGTETVKPSVTATDLRQLETLLRAQLLDQARSEFSSQLGDGEAWTPASLQIDQTLEKSFDAKVEDVAQSVSLSMKVEASGLVYHPQTAQAAGLRALGELVSADKRAVPGTAISSLVPVEGVPDRLVVTASESIFDEPPLRSLTAAIAGQPPSAVADIIAGIYPSGDVTMDLHPVWLPRLPWLPTRIAWRMAWEGR